MKILRVTQDFDNHIFPLSEAQAARGHDVTVVRPCEEGEEPKRFQRDGYNVIQSEVTFDLLGNKFAIEILRFLRQSDGFDVIHAHSHLWFSTNFAALTARLRDIPLAITNHGVHSQSVPQWFSVAYLRSLGRWTYNQADRIFCYTAVDRDCLRNYGVSSKADIIHNGINVNEFSPDRVPDDRVNSDAPSVLFAGRLVEGKRPQDVIAAIKQVRKTIPGVRLYICGDGPLRNELEDTAKEIGIRNMIDFLGHIPNEEMPGVYNAVGAVVLPSRGEGLPRTVLESLACGTPVVTSDLPQIKNIVQEAGYTVEVGDIEGYAHHLEQLLSDPRRRAELGRKGRQIVESDYTWENLVEQTTQALKKLSNSGEE